MKHVTALFFVVCVTAQTSRSVWDGVYTSDQAKRGSALYANACASCHGSALNGGESAPPLTGGEFFSNWDGLTVGDLFDRIRVSMPADNPGKLTREQDADILAYHAQHQSISSRPDRTRASHRGVEADPI